MEGLGPVELDQGNIASQYDPISAKESMPIENPNDDSQIISKDSNKEPVDLASNISVANMSTQNTLTPDDLFLELLKSELKVQADSRALHRDELSRNAVTTDTGTEKVANSYGLQTVTKVATMAGHCFAAYKGASVEWAPSIKAADDMSESFLGSGREKDKGKVESFKAQRELLRSDNEESKRFHTQILEQLKSSEEKRGTVIDKITRT